MEAIQNALETLGRDRTALSLIAAGLLFVGFVFGRIFAKAGHHPAMGFLMLVPGVNVVMLITLAFGRWPIEREMRELRKLAADGGGHGMRRAA